MKTIRENFESPLSQISVSALWFSNAHSFIWSSFSITRADFIPLNFWADFIARLYVWADFITRLYVW